MKSSLAQDLAQAVALGEPFAGRETTKTNVLFIQNENSRLTEHQRLTGSKRDSPDNLYFYTVELLNLIHGNMTAKGKSTM